MSPEERKKTLYKSVVVNEKAKRRKASLNEKHHYLYGPPTNYHELYPILAKEMDDFFTFMTRPFTSSQELPIKPATAILSLIFFASKKRQERVFTWQLRCIHLYNRAEQREGVGRLPSRIHLVVESFSEHFCFL
jgi:hypothetical protein